MMFYKKSGACPSQPANKLLGLVHLVLLATLIACLSSFAIFEVRENSMATAISNKNLVLISRWHYSLFKIKIGDIIIFTTPKEDKKSIKRCVLVAGDPIIIHNSYLYLANTSILLNAKQESFLEGYGSVPPKSIFVLGDNLAKSQDSRDYGFITYQQIKGKVILSL